MSRLAYLLGARRALLCLCPEDGLGGMKNGVLLEKAEQEFDVFLTGDRNLRLQQQVSRFNLAVVVLHAESTQLRHTLLLIPKVIAALPTIKSGQVVIVRA